MFYDLECTEKIPKEMLEVVANLDTDRIVFQEIPYPEDDSSYSEFSEGLMALGYLWTHSIVILQML